MAELEKPGHQNEVEEAEFEDSTLDSTILQTTTGGVAGDSEGDESFSVPAPLPKRERERGKTLKKG